MSELSQAERAHFVALAVTLMPGGEGMPAASGAESEGERRDHLLGLRPDLAQPLKEALGATKDMAPGDAIALLNNEHREWFDALSLLAAAAYFMSQDVRDALNYPGQQSRPVLPAEENDPRDAELLRAVSERGPIYRIPPE